VNSFNILSKNTLLEPRLFLEASAGTGKTFTIEHLIVRLLIETPLNLDEIVIVTFTRAATRELKDRIRSNLEQIIAHKISFPYLESISEEARSKLEDALKNFETAQIFTIHGFCSHLLKQFAFETGASFHLSEWTREEELWEVKQFLREQTVVSSGQIQKILSTYRFDIRRLEEALLRSSFKEAPPENSIPSLEEIEPFSITLEFESVRSSYKGMTSPDFSSQAQELQEALNAGYISQALWNKWITAPLFFLKNLEPSQLKIRATSTCSARLLQLRNLIYPALQAAQNPHSIFLRLSHAWHLYRKNISEKKGKVSPDDFLKITASKLSHPPFIQAVQKKYRAAIVDEFQDTDPLQWKIFKTLFIEDASQFVYLVGDPKQSIYAFRQADIYTFLEASQSFEITQKAALLKNFRSSSGLLQDINRLFCCAAWMDLPKQNRFLAIPEAQAAHEGEGHLCFMMAAGEKGKSSRFPTTDIEETQLFPFIVEEIQTKNLDPGSIAILVKDRYQAERVQQFLQRWMVPATLYRSTPLCASPVIEFLEEMVEATLELSPPTIKKLLLGPFASIPFYELAPDHTLKAKEILAPLRDLWISQGFATFFAAFLNTSFGKQSALATFSQNPDHYQDLLELTQKILFAQQPLELKQLLTEIKTFETKDRLSSQSQGVQIMTIHASKGLEFETVFALGLASRSPEQELPEEHLKELDAEKMRQLYVALTRAEKRLYIPIVQEIPNPTYSLGEGSPIELFISKAAPDLTTFTQEWLTHRTFHLYRHPLKNSETTPSPPPLFCPPPPGRYIQSFSSMAQEIYTPVKSDDSKRDDQGIEAGAETGIIIHRILERYFNQEGSLQTLISQETKYTKLASKTDTLHSLLQKALSLPLGSFCLNDIPLGSSQTEMEFLYSHPQGLMRGYIDLCFEYAGKFYAVDWKTNLLENTDDATIQAVMQSHDYYLQGKIYSQALQKYLHLPFGGIYFIFIRGPGYAYVE
jgi:exodeoxyribonuclease V beta subunit